VLAGNLDYQRLIQLPGVAAMTALTILAEARDMGFPTLFQAL
jgi:transposase